MKILFVVENLQLGKMDLEKMDSTFARLEKHQTSMLLEPNRSLNPVTGITAC
jgi:hypothetical protein